MIPLVQIRRELYSVILTIPMEVFMKKWHLEGVLLPITSEKLILPDSNHQLFSTPALSPCSKDCQDGTWLCGCRCVVAFFIRFF